MSRVETTHDLTTLQGVFDHVAEALLKQGRRSVMPVQFGSCAYRGNNDCKCAAGHLIPDASYDVTLEGCSLAPLSDIANDEISRHVQRIIDALDDTIPRTLPMLQHLMKLQSIHDRPSPINDDDPAEVWLTKWRANMKQYAVAVGLNASILEIAA